MKKTIILLLSAIMLFALAACGDKPDDSLPTDIDSVDVAIEGKDNDNLLPTTDIDELMQPSTTGQGKIEIDGVDIPMATSEDVKVWIVDIVPGDYTTTEKEDENIVETKAPLKSGGTVTLIDYYGGYYMTEFCLTNTGDELLEDIEKCLTAYIGRELTTAEKEGVNDCIAAIGRGADMDFLDEISNTAVVSFIVDDAGLLMQVR